VICGNPPHFQGDERDVMFLSVVDVPQEGPLRIKQEERFKQRFNVAASRARDQMWVVHSLQPQIDLQQDDLRRKLIEHTQNPRALTKLLEEGDRKVESEFERQVLRRLLTKGYRVVPQWQAGCFRIDLVVVGENNAKLAIECDGDRYHPPEKLEDDMLRQGILERRGWIFERIRGSVFFRDPDRAMQPVFQRLEAMGIEALGVLPSNVTEHDRTELQQRIIRRAEQLRKEWADKHRPATDLFSIEEVSNSRPPIIGKKRTTKRTVAAAR
jgi:very-short-patch-repair endonuclease